MENIEQKFNEKFVSDTGELIGSIENIKAFIVDEVTQARKEGYEEGRIDGQRDIEG